MGCFLVPTVGAIVSHVCERRMKKNEKKNSNHIAFSTKLGWLTRLLAGGALLLAFEHVWHGELVPWFPFLTAASNPADTAEMLHEMATAGTAMLILCVAVWGIMLAVCHHLEKQSLASQEKV